MAGDKEDEGPGVLAQIGTGILSFFTVSPTCRNLHIFCVYSGCSGSLDNSSSGSLPA